jgi:hypothetical protein
MLMCLVDVDMLVGSLKKIENTAGTEMYIYRGDEADGLQKIPCEHVEFHHLVIALKTPFAWDLISPSRDMVVE